MALQVLLVLVALQVLLVLVALQVLLVLAALQVLLVLAALQVLLVLVALQVLLVLAALIPLRRIRTLTQERFAIQPHGSHNTSATFHSKGAAHDYLKARQFTCQ